MIEPDPAVLVIDSKRIRRSVFVPPYFYAELRQIIAAEGYVEHRETDSSPTDYTFKKNVKPGVVWSLHSHFVHSKPPYAVFTNHVVPF